MQVPIYLHDSQNFFFSKLPRGATALLNSYKLEVVLKLKIPNQSKN